MSQSDHSPGNPEKVAVLKGRTLRELSIFCTWRLAQAAPHPLGTTTEEQARGYLTRDGHRDEREDDRDTA